MPKSFAALAGTRATARSFDDRVGCAAQLLALRHLDARRLRHAVLFVWSTREEIGLEGARFAAEHVAASEHPARVYAIDTFVSSDAPLEIKTFADAPLGGGAVVRAVDNSSVTPPALVDSLLALARARHIPLVAGTTNGGNDGSTFTRFGVPDVGLGWPLRYAHSPAEVDRPAGPGRARRRHPAHCGAMVMPRALHLGLRQARPRGVRAEPRGAGLGDRLDRRHAPRC